MLTAHALNGPILDMANNAALNLTQSAAGYGPTAPVPGSSAGGTDVVGDILDVAKTAAEAQKRKATWVLVGVGVGGLILGLLIGRYAVPSRKKRK
jgi:alpha-beta hydrolase superfamily lysophospholipase